MKTLYRHKGITKFFVSMVLSEFTLKIGKLMTSRQSLTNLNKLQMQDTRVWKLKKNSTRIVTSKNYTSLSDQTYDVLKRNARILRKPKLLHPTSHISKLKLKDINDLKLINVNELEKEFYSKLKSST